MSKARKQRSTASFRNQMRQSLADLESIMDRRQSPSGGGRFTARTIEVTEPSSHNASSVRAIRKSLNVSQVVFSHLLGVSPALVRAWELGARVPAPIARRLLDQVRERPSAFSGLVRAFDPTARAKTPSVRARNVA